MEKTTVVNPALYNEDLEKKTNQPVNEHPELAQMEHTGEYDGLIDEVKDEDKKSHK